MDGSPGSVDMGCTIDGQACSSAAYRRLTPIGDFLYKKLLDLFFLL
jgi:hypothetical protein